MLARGLAHGDEGERQECCNGGSHLFVSQYSEDAVGSRGRRLRTGGSAPPEPAAWLDTRYARVIAFDLNSIAGWHIIK